MSLDNFRALQGAVCREVEDTLSSSLLPSSILFSGPRGSGRLSSAFDLSFCLTGEEDMRDSLRSSRIIYFPMRNLSAPLSAAISIYRSDRTQRARHFLLESARKALMQYHPALADAASTTASQNFSQASELDAALLSFEDEGKLGAKEEGEVLKMLEKATDPRFLYWGRKNPGAVSIDQIRCVQEWFVTTSGEKCVIFENVEDGTEGARNSLLKMLEEPADSCHMILVSEREQRLLETILSRVRKYRFPSLGEKKVASLIRNRFGEWREYTSWDAFFFEKGSGEEARAEMEADVAKASAIIGGGKMSDDDEEALFSSLEKLSAWPYFISRMTGGIEKEWRSGKISAKRAGMLLGGLSRMEEECNVFNMSRRMAWDKYMREMEA